MKIKAECRDGRLTLYLSGELDHHEARVAMRETEDCIDRCLPRECVLEMSALRFMDSSGIALLLRTHKQLRELGGEFWLENPRAQPLRVIDAAGIERLVPIKVTAKEK